MRANCVEQVGISKYIPILFQGTFRRKHVEKWLMYCKLFKNSLTTYDVLESFENDAKPQLDLEGHKQNNFTNNCRIGIDKSMRGSNLFLQNRLLQPVSQWQVSSFMIASSHVSSVISHEEPTAWYSVRESWPES